MRLSFNLPAALAALMLAFSLAGCSNSADPPHTAAAAAVAAVAAEPKPGDLELGRKIYNFRCYFCHGYSGNAQTLAASYLEPKPRDFTALTPEQLPRARMLDAVAHGRPGTAMKGFADILKPEEIAAVTDFVRHEFMLSKARNTAYHTPENGWPNHDRYAAAFPFATGKIALDKPVEQLSADERIGRKLFMSACVSCHDRAKVASEGTPWDPRPLSYPRNGFTPGDWPPQQVDGITSATPYHLHDRIPKIAGLTAAEKHGEQLFQQNCAFCHAADGTARNWIGSFLEPHPRDLTSPVFMNTMTRERLAGVIRDGLPGTSMPAWRSVLSDDDVQALVSYIGRAFHPLGNDKPVASRNN